MRALVLVPCLAAIVVCAGDVATRRHAFPGQNGDVAFVRLAPTGGVHVWLRLQART